ncbi:MAG: hypothetical protein U0929_01710 [Planctomycetaceae bacterium]
MAAPEREIALTSTDRTKEAANIKAAIPEGSSQAEQQSISSNENILRTKKVNPSPSIGESGNNLAESASKSISMAPPTEIPAQKTLAEPESPAPPAEKENKDDSLTSEDAPQSVESPKQSVSYLDIPVWDSQSYVEKPLVDSISRFEPKVFGSGLALRTDEIFEIVGRDDSQTWNLLVKASPSSDRSKSLNAVKNGVGDGIEKTLGVFSLKEGGLNFKWENNTDKQYISGFRRCLLQIDKTGRCFQLSKPLDLGPINLLQTQGEQDSGLREMIPPSTITSVRNWRCNKAFGDKFLLVEKDTMQNGGEKGTATCSTYIEDLEGQRIAEAEVELRSVNENDENQPLLVVRLYALVPGDDDKPTRTLWTADKRDDKDNDYHLPGIQKERTKITGSQDESGEKAYIDSMNAWIKDVDAAWDESGAIRNPEQMKIVQERWKKQLLDVKLRFDDLGNLTEDGKTHRNRKRTLIDKNKKRLELLRKKESWASKMEVLMNSLESGASVSFDLYYEVDGGDAPLTFTVAAVTASMTTDSRDKME